jgi:hypothetical protein
VRRRGVLLIAGSLGLAAAGVWAVRPPSTAAPAWAAHYDVTARRPELLEPGTVVGDGPPEGWSHLVIKSLPRIRPAYRAQVADHIAGMTSWLFTAFVADVQPEEQGGEMRHRLRTVAMGMGTAVNGRHVIVTKDTASTHGVESNLITNEILKEAYEVQALAAVVAHGPTMGLVDTPVWYRCGESNQLIRFRYALLVDASTGRLDALVWALAPGGCRDAAEAVWLNPSQLDPAELIPDKKQFSLFGIPNKAAFGVDRLPPHRAKTALPAELLPLATRTAYTPDEARDLEAALRRLARD